MATVRPISYGPMCIATVGALHNGSRKVVMTDMMYLHITLRPSAQIYVAIWRHEVMHVIINPWKTSPTCRTTTYDEWRNDMYVATRRQKSQRFQFSPVGLYMYEEILSANYALGALSKISQETFHKEYFMVSYVAFTTIFGQSWPPGALFSNME